MNRTRTAIATLGLLLCMTAMAQPGGGGAPDRPPFARESSMPTLDVGALIEKLADEMDKEFVLDPRMRGIFSGSTAGEDADYETLLAVLRQGGFATIETADQVLIVPEASIRTQPSRVLLDDDRRVSDHEIVTRIIDVSGTMRSADGSETPIAAQLVPLLRPMMSQNAQLGALTTSNRLVLVDRYDNVRRIAAVIEALTR